MGQSKNSSKIKKESTVTSKQSKALDKMIAEGEKLMKESADIYRGFGPGGQAAQSVTDEANRNFQQTTLPSILNSYGSGNKGSSGLNQALASGAANLNSSIAAQMANMQLQGAQGLGNLGSGQANTGAGTKQFENYQQQQNQPFWQSAILAATGAAGKAAGGV